MDFSTAASATPEQLSPRRAHHIVRVLDHILAWGLRLMVFLVPLVITPWTFESFEFPKQFLLFGVTITLVALWLARGVVAREVRFVSSPLSWGVLAFLLVTGLATVFSIDWITSTLGFYGRFNGGLLSVISYALVYFMTLQLAHEPAQVKWLMGAWLAGIGVGAVVLLLQMFGVHVVPLALAGPSSFTPLGRSLNSVVILLAACFPLALLFARLATRAWVRWAALIFSVLALVLVFLIDYQLGWIALLVAAALWLLAMFWKNEAVALPWTLIPSLALLLTVIGWPVVTPSITHVPVPVEVNLSQQASWQIATQNAKSNLLLGTGPETFIYGFSKYKPDNFNDSDFWAFRFDKAASEFAQVFATAGSFGLAAMVALVVLGLLLAWRLLRDRKHEAWYLHAALVVSFMVLTLGLVFYFANTVFALGWWLTLGLMASLSSRRTRHVSLSDSARASFAFSFALAVVVLAAAAGWLGLGRFFAADVAYARAQAALTAGSFDQAEANLNRAVTLNPLRDAYYIGLAQVRLALANRVAQQPLGKTDADKQAQLGKLQSYIRSSIDAAQAATNLGHANVADWEALGSIYRGTAPYAQDAEQWVISSFQQAIVREPKNPALYTELGKAYLISASRKRQAAAASQQEADKAKLQADANTFVTKALEQFTQAVKLKSDYTPAHFNQALAYELQGKVDDAIDKLASIRRYNPQDVDVLYELGNLYYGKASYGEAETAFSTITKLDPNHVNAHYGLALTYDREAKRDQAVAELQQVLQLTPTTNPNRQLVQQQLDALQRGEALPSVPPPAATPPSAKP